MGLNVFPLADYCALLDSLGQLAAPVPEGLDLGRAVELVSYNSREAVPGTLFLCKGAHFKPEYLAAPPVGGPLPTSARRPILRRASPASWCGICGR